MIFGYGIYELVISDIDPRQQEPSDVRHNLLNIESLDGLKQKLTKVIVVALIVTFQIHAGVQGHHEHGAADVLRRSFDAGLQRLAARTDQKSLKPVVDKNRPKGSDIRRRHGPPRFSKTPERHDRRT